jgi:alkylated DNA repair dioxygenase AlkB
MTIQGALFEHAPGDDPTHDWPKGFRYRPEMLSPYEEQELLACIRTLAFKAFDFHGFRGKRRVVSFGWQYDFSAQKVREAKAIPGFLLNLRQRAAEFAGLEASQLQHVLVTEYDSGAGIGWHKDKAVFGLVIGISLLAHCVFRLRRRAGDRWERVSLVAEPRSAYLLSGEVRDDWQHSIPPVNSLRYSVTFRNLRGD